MVVSVVDVNAPEFTRRFPNLADASLGAEAIFATDEFFADKARMLNPEPAVFIPGKYDLHGKWMDGWETRRRRQGGYDHCIVKLARSCIVKGVDIDTSHFTGNYPPAASIEATYCEQGNPDETANWVELIPSASLQGNSHHYLEVTDSNIYTHLRVNIYPDGGIARLRVYGQPCVDWTAVGQNQLDLAALENGAYVVDTNNQHFGAASNLLKPGRGTNMGDGWETRRRREPGNDWCIIALAHPGRIGKIEIDTAHFKGNYPDRASIQAAYVTGGTDNTLKTQAMFWATLLPEQKLQMDHQHVYESEIIDLGLVTHIRFNIFPDGGVSRLRLWGTVE
jgi:allantoicase